MITYNYMALSHGFLTVYHTINHRKLCKIRINVLIESLSEESDSTTLDIWIIVLVVILLLLALAIMLIIGMYCACNKRYTPDKNLELLPRASSNSQIPLNYQ